MSRLGETKTSVAKEKLAGEANEPQVNKAETMPRDQNDRVSLRFYKDILLSSIWVILAFIAAGIGIAYITTLLITPTYQITTTLMVSKVNIEQMSSYEALVISKDLARAYVETITSRGVLGQVSALLDSRVSAEELGKSVTATHIIDTQLMEISVEHSDPQLAVEIANKVAEVFSNQIKKEQDELVDAQDDEIKMQLLEAEKEITRLRENLQDQSLQIYNQRVETINEAIKDSREQIEKLDQEIIPLQAKYLPPISEQIELAKKETRREELYTSLMRYQEELALLTLRGPTFDSGDFTSSQDYILLNQNQNTRVNLLESHQNLRITRMLNRLTVRQVKQPVVPESPIRPKLSLNLALGFAAGLLFSMIYIFIAKLDGS